ncbi:isochorismatase [Xylariomycetidae sp. FL2044]|nr:isochorismatase [Xylariomycetidae sp. FL2044]
MAQDIKFGPEGNQWHYKRDSKTFDLSRGSEKKVTLGTSRGPAGTKIEINPAKTALVIVDMQNFFLDQKCCDHPTGLAAVKPLLTTISKCRKLGIEIIWLNWGLTDVDLARMPAGVLRGFANSRIAQHQDPVRSGLGENLGHGLGCTLVAGTWNAAIWPPLAAAVNPAADTHCAKNRMSGLWAPDQPLWRHLERADRKNTTLLFAGVNTDECVLGTLVDAYNAGWDCVLVDDCCGTTTPDGHAVTGYNVENYYGFVVDSKAIEAGVISSS